VSFEVSLSRNQSCILLVGLKWPFWEFLFFSQRTDYCPAGGVDFLV
jgi:hypothetical protein